MTATFSISEEPVSIGAGELNCARGPKSGGPMVLLHGVTNWWQSFEPVMPALGARWTVWAPDFRGHGKSSHVPNGYRWSEYAKDTVGLIRALSDQPVVLVGHSLGASVALQVGADAPELISALVLEEPVLYGHTLDRLKVSPLFPYLQAYERMARSNGTPDEILPQLAELHGVSDNPEVMRGKANSLSLMDSAMLSMQFEGAATNDYDTDAYLEGLRCPVLVLRGEAVLGSAISDEDWERALKRKPGLSEKQFAGLGHWISRERPEEFCTTVTEFLNAL